MGPQMTFVTHSKGQLMTDPIAQVREGWKQLNGERRSHAY
jgi:hypothetical protein